MTKQTTRDAREAVRWARCIAGDEIGLLTGRKYRILADAEEEARGFLCVILAQLLTTAARGAARGV